MWKSGRKRDGVWNNDKREYWIDEVSPIQHFKPFKNILDHYPENDLLRYGYIIAVPNFVKVFGKTQIYDKISIFNKEMGLTRKIAKFDDLNEHFELVTKLKNVMD